MATVNLLPVSERQKRKSYLRNYYALVGGVVLVSGLLVLAALLLLFDQVYRLNLDAARNQKVQAEGQAALYLDVEKKAQALSQQLDKLKQAQGQTTHWSSLMTTLQQYTPPGVSIRSITIKPAAQGAGQGTGSSKTTVEGMADSRRSAAQFQIGLANSPYFKDVEMESTESLGSVISYRISLDVNFHKLAGPG